MVLIGEVASFILAFRYLPLGYVHAVAAVTPHGVEYKIRYFLEPADVSPSKARNTVTRAVVAHINQAGLALSYPRRDIFVAEMASKTPGRVERAERWIASDRDRTAQAGWDLMNLVALSDEDVADDYLAAQLRLIAQRIEGYGNWTRRSASNAITGIGLRNDVLEAAARRTASTMGQVEFDPGQTSCVMPDPIEYLEKTKAHRARQAEQRAAKAGR